MNRPLTGVASMVTLCNQANSACQDLELGTDP